MKLILLSDMHLTWNNPVCRLDNLVETQFNKLGFIIDYASENGLPILQAGDFFDAPRSYYFLEQVIGFLKNSPSVDIYAVFGGKRHDTYLYSNETRAATNLGILERIGLVEILGSTPVSLSKGVNIYGASFGEAVPVVNTNGFNMLVIHAPISENPSIGELDADDFLLSNPEYDLILCGDIHRNFGINFSNKKKVRCIINTGPMLRDTADLYNFEHEPCFAVFDTDSRTLEWVTIPHKPSEEVMSRDHIDSKKDINGMLDEFTIAISTGTEFTADLVENMRLFMKDNKNELGHNTIEILTELINRKEGQIK